MVARSARAFATPEANSSGRSLPSSTRQNLETVLVGRLGAKAVGIEASQAVVVKLTGPLGDLLGVAVACLFHCLVEHVVRRAPACTVDRGHGLQVGHPALVVAWKARARNVSRNRPPFDANSCLGVIAVHTRV